MKMILHIFRKDLRRHRIEIGLYMLACAAWAWETAHPFGWVWLTEKEFVPIVLFGLWFVVTVRVVQGESLVGDREFWMTRPYRWGQLLAAKALLLIVCLNLPLLIAEIFLLASANIPLSWHLAPGLIFLQLEFLFFITFPAAALASVTESLVQWLMTIGAMAVYALAVTWLPWSKLPPALSGGETAGTAMGMAVTAPALAFVILWRYKRRRVWPARLAFGGALLAVPLVVLLACTPLIRSLAYPETKSNAPMQISMAEDDSGVRSYKRIDDLGSQTGISLPVKALLTDSDTEVSVDGLRVTLTGDNGWAWHSQWLNNSIRFSKESPLGSIGIMMPTNVADQVARAHAMATVEFAFEVYRLGPPHKVDTGSDEFELPGGTYCRWIRGVMENFNFNGMSCATPLHLPEVMEVRIDSDSNTCQEGSSEQALPAGHYAEHVEYGSNWPADFDLDPVRRVNLNFGQWIPMIRISGDSGPGRNASACRGTPLAVRLGEREGQMRATYKLGSVGIEIRSKAEDDEPVLLSPRE
jgi:hypothetical protein